MFGLGFAEVILIAVLALIFIGPKQLPDVARVIVKLINEWKRATSEFTRQFKDLRSDLQYHVENNSVAKPTASSPPAPVAPVSTASSTPDDGKKNTEGGSPS